MTISNAELNILNGLSKSRVAKEDIQAITDQQFFDAVMPLVLRDQELHTFAVVEGILGHELANDLNTYTLVNTYVRYSRNSYSIQNIAGGLSKLAARQALFTIAPYATAASYIGMEDVISYEKAVKLASGNQELAERFLKVYPSTPEVEDYVWERIRRAPGYASIWSVELLAEKTTDPHRLMILAERTTNVVNNPIFTVKLAAQYLADSSNKAQFDERLAVLEDKERFEDFVNSVKRVDDEEDFLAGYAPVELVKNLSDAKRKDRNEKRRVNTFGRPVIDVDAYEHKVFVYEDNYNSLVNRIQRTKKKVETGDVELTVLTKLEAKLKNFIAYRKYVAQMKFVDSL